MVHLFFDRRLDFTCARDHLHAAASDTLVCYETNVREVRHFVHMPAREPPQSGKIVLMRSDADVGLPHDERQCAAQVLRCDVSIQLADRFRDPLGNLNDKSKHIALGGP